MGLADHRNGQLNFLLVLEVQAHAPFMLGMEEKLVFSRIFRQSMGIGDIGMFQRQEQDKSVFPGQNLEEVVCW